VPGKTDAHPDRELPYAAFRVAGTVIAEA